MGKKKKHLQYADELLAEWFGPEYGSGTVKK